MRTVAVTGSSGSVGRRVCDLLAADDSIQAVVALDLENRRNRDPKILETRVDLRRDDLKPLIEDADTVIHLASSFDPSNDGVDTAHVDIDATQRVLDAASGVGVSRLVLLSSAMVYGAWPANPVPITEDMAVRPNPEFSFAVVKAHIERLANDWRQAHPDSEVVLLRPTTALAEDEVSWVARSLKAAAVIEVGDQDPPVQFVHLDDLASAVVLASAGGLDGPYNVAPDGYVDGDVCRELSGRVPRVRLPEEAAEEVGRFRWRHRLAPTPPGITPYIMYPWVIANDRLRAAGWEPKLTNEQAYVDGTPAKPWATMNAKRRQQIALGGVAIAAIVVSLGLAWLVRRARR
jgi:nucleoside-diphosphate-sugar epimerase